MDVELQIDILECIQPKPDELPCGTIMRDTFGEWAQRKCAQRKRKGNNLGAIVRHCGSVNRAENIAEKKEQLEFCSSMAKAQHLEAAEKEEKCRETERELGKNAHGAAT